MPKKIQIIHMFLMAIAMVIIATGCVTKGVFPGEQCILLFENDTESISAEVLRDSDGCIKEKSVKFYPSTDCTGDRLEHKFTDPEKGFIFASSTMGGCPQLVEVTTKSPVCVTLTLKSGRETTVCYPN